MAVEIGTATDHVDLYNKLHTFLTTNADLVAAGQEWSQVWGAAAPFTADDEGVMLQGPGLAGTDEVLVSFKLHADPVNDIFGFWIAGHAGIVGSSTEYDNHVNSSEHTFVPLIDQATPYWFVANGRRFVVVCKISTVFTACYGGLFMPYSAPSGYPYPMFVGGCSRDALRWSSESTHYHHFINPTWAGPNSDGRAWVRGPGGGWTGFYNLSYSDPSVTNNVFPWRALQNDPVEFYANQQELVGGGHLLHPATLLANGSTLRGALGILDGVFHVPGFGNAAENIVTVDGVDHLVVPDVFRAGFTDYWALRLA